jgi:hypothetical protein
MTNAKNLIFLKQVTMLCSVQEKPLVLVRLQYISLTITISMVGSRVTYRLQL